jgi:hypothetical protein
MTVEDLFKKIGAQTMEIDALRQEIDRLTAIISSLEQNSVNNAIESTAGAKKAKGNSEKAE